MYAKANKILIYFTQYSIVFPLKAFDQFKDKIIERLDQEMRRVDDMGDNVAADSVAVEWNSLDDEKNGCRC